MLSAGLSIRVIGQAPAPLPAAQPSPAADPAMTAFGVHCADCHGEALQGGRAGSLLDDTWTYGEDDTSLATTIRDGRAEAGMPSFRGAFTDGQIRELVALIHTRAARAKGTPAARATPMVDGVVTSAKHRIRIETLTDQLESRGTRRAARRTRSRHRAARRLRILDHGKLSPPVAGVPKVWARQDGGLFDVEAHPRFAGTAGSTCRSPSRKATPNR